MGDQLPLFDVPPSDPYADVYRAIDAVPERCPECGGFPVVVLVAPPLQLPNIVLAEVKCSTHIDGAASKLQKCPRFPVLLDLKVTEREQWPDQVLRAWSELDDNKTEGDSNGEDRN